MSYNHALEEFQKETFSKTTFGFWLYLMTDCLLFGTLFCTYGVLHNQTNGGATSQEIFDLKLVFTETMFLLFSSFTSGMALLASVQKSTKKIIFWLAITFILGLSFVLIEYFEFKMLIQEGNSYQQSAFLSSYFTLVGTHGLHVTAGLFWILLMIAQLQFLNLTVETFRRLVLFNMFWHFLDLVWIFIFTFVYLMGVI